jgi:hypothetical protein
MPEGGKRNKAFSYFLKRDNVIKTILWLVYLFCLIQFLFTRTLDTWKMILILLICSAVYGVFEHYTLKGINRIFPKKGI